MLLFLWQKLSLLILIQLLQPNSVSFKKVEAFHACKSAFGIPQQSIDRIRGCSCIRQQAFVDCYKLNDPGSVEGGGSCPFHLQSSLIKLSYFPPNLFLSESLTQPQENIYKSESGRIATTFDGDSTVPTFTPLQSVHNDKPRNREVAALIGGVGAALLVVIIVVLVYVWLMRIKRHMTRTSEAASSVLSPTVELQRPNSSSYAGALPSYGTKDLSQLTILELEHATCKFSQSTIIGEGVFGFVHKGLLYDGSIVAIKRVLHIPTHYFRNEVKHLALVQHKNLVKLIGYCEDSHQQFLIFEYIPNGNVGNHLYDREGLPTGRLNIQQRLLIALGAATGLQHLHSLVPPILHMHFRTSNVLLDGNFTAKVSDYGLSKFIIDGHRAGSSSAVDCFLDPELNFSKIFSEQSDVYSFGVFLLELISGHDACGKNQSNPEQNLVLQAKNSTVFDFIDKTLGNQTMHAAERMMELALLCVDISSKRPSMSSVVEELEQIQETQIGYLHSPFDEEIGAVTLGSALFK